MSLKDLIHLFSKSDEEKDLKKKLTSLEKNIEELQKSLVTFQEDKINNAQAPIQQPPIIIEKINIEKIILDKYELNNNLGQLGIKELKGKLNIGATYGSEFTPKLDENGKNERKQNEKVQKQSPGNGPKVNIHAKQE